MEEDLKIPDQEKEIFEVFPEREGIDWEQRRWDLASALYINRVLSADRCVVAADKLIKRFRNRE
jgi:hypothetical protein